MTSTSESSFANAALPWIRKAALPALVATGGTSWLLFAPISIVNRPHPKKPVRRATTPRGLGPGSALFHSTLDTTYRESRKAWIRELTAYLRLTILNAVIITQKPLEHFETTPTFERCGGENCGNCEPSCEKCCESVSSQGGTGPAVRSVTEARLSLR